MANTPTILAIDPGPERSGWIMYDGVIITRRIDRNSDLCYALGGFIDAGVAKHLVIEMVASYGMAVGADVFRTCVWIGRFEQAFSGPFTELERKTVKLHLCGSMRAKDSNIRQALIDRFGPGREKAIGTKKQPGPLHGFKRDMWSALALAVTWMDQQQKSGAKRC